MTSINVNNGGKLELTQDKERELIILDTGERRDGITEGDMVMLMNYYVYIKDNDIQCDFINYNGKYNKTTK